MVSQRLLNEAAKSPTPISAAGYFTQAEETMVLDQEALMGEISTEHRYQKQVAGKLAFLDGLTDPDLVRVYEIVRKAGKALPQEKLIGLKLP